MSAFWTRLARLRVPLGFAAGAIAIALARPSWRSLAIGLSIAAPGELLRVWAAGHIDKGREITRSGPYRFFRHPLYLGSLVMGFGFVIAAASGVVAVLVVSYLALTYAAAMRTEEAALDARFGGAYSAYREGRAAPVTRSFSWARVRANREYRAAAGFVLVSIVLALRAAWPAG
jgi:hypothetical protein